MARLFSRLVIGAAAVSLIATPAMARDHWGHGRHHGNGISAGDVFAGVLILGGIAAIAGAASNDRNRDDDYRYREPYPDQHPVYREQPGYSGTAYGGGIDSAVSQCVGEVERGDERVAAVDNAARTANGWQISGQLDAGGNFSRAIDNDGRIRSVDLGDGYSYNDDARIRRRSLRPVGRRNLCSRPRAGRATPNGRRSRRGYRPAVG